MEGAKSILVAFVFILIACPTVKSCNRLTSPCAAGECCMLVFNFKLLSYSFCRKRNRNDSKCAQDDYCLLDSDCNAEGKCEGATRTRWGRCIGGLNPCLKNIKK